jgi:hypothetical protein
VTGDHNFTRWRAARASLHLHETIVLAYMSSCVRETITGGTVVVGSGGGKVVAGSIERTRLDLQ